MKINTKGNKPSKASAGAAAYDLRATSRISIAPFERVLVKTGVTIELPPDCVGMVCPRSGIALKNGVTVLNAPGIIDPDYRGEIGVILINLGNNFFEIHPGDRVAQLLICRFEDAEFEDGDLSSTERGEGGFGSTGNG